METPNSSLWSELPMDILRSVFKRLTFIDFHRAKIVSSNWYSCSKQTLPKKNRSPWLILFPENDVCALYNPDEARVYKTKRDFSGIRFLANSGNWFLVLDSKSNLYIIDLFSERKIHLPPLESMKSGHYSLERVGDNDFKNAKDLREEYIVVWYVDIKYIAVCKNGEDHYRSIPRRLVSIVESDTILQGGGDSLYLSLNSPFIQKLDLSRQEGFKELTENDVTIMPFYSPCRHGDYYDTTFRNKIVVTTSGELLLVVIIFYEATRHRVFHLYKKDHSSTNSSSLVKVHSLGDEALILDLGITVPAYHTLGIYWGI
ncbi:hypothetical protein CARUB_v10003244mg [Capsella rubella]|uniref:F-box domain-containing protein n=1 Tax=Capsella rubella TaxID=81985 RepID=R0HC38_9BRAS|nr:hypothetical protein CARUB_v10003244mg [Capsella rubella]